MCVCVRVCHIKPSMHMLRSRLQFGPALRGSPPCRRAIPLRHVCLCGMRVRVCTSVCGPASCTSITSALNRLRGQTHACSASANSPPIFEPRASRAPSANYALGQMSACAVCRSFVDSGACAEGSRMQLRGVCVRACAVQPLHSGGVGVHMRMRA